MIGRREYKYLVPTESMADIRNSLLPFVDPDPFMETRKEGQYTVKSVYYDTARLDCYREKTDGVNPRNKLRIRGYDECHEDSLVFLEVRRKRQDFVVKDRAPLLRKDLYRFLASRDVDRHIVALGGNGCEGISARRFLYHYLRGRLSPVALVVYDREAYVGKFDSRLRITFDKNLRGTLFPSLDMLHTDVDTTPAMSSSFILEVKFFEGLPGSVQSLTSRHRLSRRSLSKYTICVDSLGLDTRSHRTLMAKMVSSRASNMLRDYRLTEMVPHYV